jgi:Tol biopolymer transport system component
MRAIDVAAFQSEGGPSAWTAFCDSTRIDWPGRFSRDGQRVSFTSDRDGPQQILVASRDGSKLRTVTTFDGLSLGLASWSPDGEHLVFDGVDARGVHGLYVVGAEGGPTRSLAQGSDRRTNPEWSRDGRWIYFVSSATGRREIWKVPAAGGSPVQLTTEGGDEPREAPDGKTVYFLETGQSPYVTATLRQISNDGGKSSTVLAGIRPAGWDVTDAGIVFLSGSPGIVRDETDPDTIDFFSFADRRVRRLGQVPFPVTGRGFQPARALIASPDGRSIVLSHMDKSERDILVADIVR